VATLVLARSDKGHPSRRYRPGRPYDFQPIWYLASPEQVQSASAAPAALTGERARPALEPAVIENSAGEPVLPGPTGGASDRW
jgi:hypothetical protein